MVGARPWDGPGGGVGARWTDVSWTRISSVRATTQPVLSSGVLQVIQIPRVDTDRRRKSSAKTAGRCGGTCVANAGRRTWYWLPGGTGSPIPPGNQSLRGGSGSGHLPPRAPCRSGNGAGRAVEGE